MLGLLGLLTSFVCELVCFRQQLSAEHFLQAGLELTIQSMFQEKEMRH